MDVTTKELRTQVPKSVLIRWNDMRRHGDFSELLKLVGVGKTQLREALNLGLATPSLQKRITDSLVAMDSERKAAEKELEKQHLAALKNA